MNQEMQICTDMAIAIVGVIGTLAGTVLGWLLNNLSNKGKLRISIVSFEDLFRHNEIGCMVSSSSINETKQYSYKIVMDLYNSSAETKVFKNLKVIFSDGEKDLIVSVPNDDSTGRSEGYIHFYDSVAPLNIPPKSILRISVHNTIWNADDKFSLIWKTKRVYMSYMDERNKQKKIKIKSEDYSKYFENHKVEEQ